jgi:hypothetical protein
MKTPFLLTAIAAVTVGLALCGVSAGEPTELMNLALHKPYTLAPAPSYGYCTDPEDATQLTDGVRTQGHFWTQKTTIGWSGGATKLLTIDLGEVQPIAGASFSTAAGIADVEWPAELFVFVSDDKVEWHLAGDLLDLSAATTSPPANGYATHVFRTTGMKTHGRYVQIAATPAGSYLFVDEVEVYRGRDEWLREPLPGEPLSSVGDHLATERFNGLIKAQLRRDLDAVRQDVEAPGLTEAQQQEFGRRVEGLSKQITDMPLIPREGFRAVLPMTALEREIFRLQAAVWRAQRKPGLRVWKTHRWDPLDPSQEPDGEAQPVLEVRTMSNEYRADVLNVTNAAETDQTVRVRLEGLPGGTNPNYVQVHEVLTVGTRRFVAVSAALPPARKEGDDYAVTVPAGMTKQLWFGFHPTAVEPGEHRGRVVLRSSSGDTREVELRLRLYPLRFPHATTLLLGGWDYTDGGGGRGVNAQNCEAFIAHLREHLVNTPWASGAAMPLGEYDEAGNLTKEPDAARFDEWVARWPGAKCYMVFNAFGDWGNTTTAFAGSEAGTELFDKKVANWIRFWAQHLRDLGLSPKQLGLLLFDEPHSEEQFRVLAAFARAINGAEPEVILWVDPQPGDSATCLEALAAMDVLVPFRKQWLRSDEWFGKLFLDQQKQGRELGFYSCDGPARRFDPFSYYLLQEWHCFAIGGRWAQFWSFGDTSGANVWNEYATDGPGPFTPLYLDDAGVTGSKYMEAIREGAEDYEYLVLLRDKVATAGQNADPAVARARKLLETACERVLAGETRDNYTWDQDKDRSVADTVRTEILEALVALSGR